MTILDVLTGVGIPAERLRLAIKAWGDSSPDLKTEADKLIAQLDATLSPASIGNLSLVVAQEGKNILSGKFDGREHPSDAA